MSFAAKVVFITGAGSGMGRLAAQNLAEQGAIIAGLDLNEDGLAETRGSSQAIHTFPCDVSDTDAVEECVRKTEKDLGPIARVYSAAGIMPTALLMDQPTRTILKITEANYIGVVNVAKATLPAMFERGRGELINFASMAGWQPTPYLGAYNASKFAVVAFSEVLHNENRGRGVKMVCVCPPPVATPLMNTTIRPKAFDYVNPISAQDVLDEIDKCLKKNKQLCFPSASSRAQWVLRRFMPNTIWASIRRIEGLS